jgi:hypothetical protein
MFGKKAGDFGTGQVIHFDLNAVVLHWAQRREAFSITETTR